MATGTRAWWAYIIGLGMTVWTQAQQPATASSPTPTTPAEAPAEPGTTENRPGREMTPAADAEELASLRAAYTQHVLTLSNPFFEGRCPGTRGNQDAADYLQYHFEAVGLEPAFTIKNAAGQEKKTYFQTFVPRRLRNSGTRIDGQSASYTGPGGQVVTLAGEKDFTALGHSGNGEASATLVFVGYGIPSGDDGYVGFGGPVELKGKIAVVLRFEPMDGDGTSKWADEGWSPQAGLPGKIEAVSRRGAAGIILVNPPGAKDERAGRLMTLEESLPSGEPMEIPVIMVSTEAADAMVRAADEQGRGLMELRQLADRSGEMVELPKATATISARVSREPQTTDNVGGVLRGRGALADEYVVVGAHYDHVGFGDFGSRDPNGRGKLHPGADDNASGTSGMLLVAARMAERYKSLPEGASARSVLFLGFSAEESGLEGSAYYTRHMIAPREKHYYMLNLDMIGRLRDAPPMEAMGVGSAEGLAEWIQPYFDSAGFAIAPKKGSTPNSDHANFFRVQIPITFFFTGLHEEYHMPTDVGALINTEGAAKIVDLATRVVYDLSLRTEPLPFAGDSPRNDDNQTAAERPRVRVIFGIRPGDYADEKPGVVIGGLTPNTPAEKAGLKQGDRILTWNGKDVKDVEAWVPLLRDANPGDVVEIGFERDGKAETVKVTLEARGGRRNRD